MTKNIIISLVFVLIASSAWSFDGNRQGFVVGGGLGFTPAAQWKVNDLADEEETKSGIGGNLIIGYAWNEFNMIVYETNLASYKSDLFNQSLLQGFRGVSWYHYFVITGEPTIFANIGLGFYSFDGENFNPNKSKASVLFGIGNEFNRHWQIAIYLSLGKTSDGSFDFTHNHINLIVTGVAF